jgi:hypothetical protein
MKSATVQGEFEGRLSDDGTKITGEWRQGGLTIPLVLGKGEAPPRKRRPQEPEPPLPYDPIDVRFPNVSAGIELAGTLTVPRTEGPHPAAVLVSGSGAQDRDETLLGHKPFLVLADHLTRNGIAVLRYDDRGTAESGGSFATATTADFMGDALAAVVFLKTRDGIDPTRIGMVGHSEGGLIAPMAAVQSRDVAFIVMLAGPGVPGADVLSLQIEKIARAAGTPEERIQRSLRAQSRIYEIMRTESDTARRNPELRTLLRTAVDSLSEADRAALGSDEATIAQYVEEQVRQLNSPWFQFFLAHDPRPDLAKVGVPVLALIGELDMQVPPEQNLPEIEAALRRGGNPDVTVRRLPRLNHLFQTATTGGPAEYGTIDETFAPAALDLIASWIRVRFAPMTPRR